MTTLDDHIDALFDGPFVFRDRPTSAPSDLRPVWRVPVALLLVRSCRGAKATHEQLHVLNWAVRSSAGAQTLSSYLAGEIEPDRAIVRFEPALDRAVALARGFGLLEWKAKNWVLTDNGAETVDQVDAEASMLAREKALLAQLPTPLTQAAVKALLRRTGSY